MVYAPQYDTAVTREAAWMTTDPPAGWAAAPPLMKATGGYFDIGQGYLRSITKSGRNLYVLRESTAEARLAFGGMKEWRHHMLVIVYWSIESHTGQLEVEEQANDTAIAAVLTRIRGPLGDHSHGGAFVGVAEDQSEIRVEAQNYVPNLEAGLIETHIRYIATDTFVA